jgi:hypothetical protein
MRQEKPAWRKTQRTTAKYCRWQLPCVWSYPATKQSNDSTIWPTTTNTILQHHQTPERLVSNTTGITTEIEDKAKGYTYWSKMAAPTVEGIYVSTNEGAEESSTPLND